MDSYGLRREQLDYLGFPTRPAGRSAVEDKFMRLAAPVAGEALAADVVRAVERLERTSLEELCSLLERVGRPLAGGVRHG